MVSCLSGCVLGKLRNRNQVLWTCTCIRESWRESKRSCADDSGTISILLETHREFWKALRLGSFSYASAALGVIDQLLAFVRAFLLLSDSNRIAIFAVHDNACPLIYASAGLKIESGALTSQSSQIPAAEIKSRLAKLAANSEGGQEDGPVLAGALSRVLCLLHKIHLRSPAGRKSRVLCLQVSPDVSSQYIAFMNAIFSAQRSGVVIDACMLGGGHSSLLQQACHLTGGIFTKPARPEALLQYLLVGYMGDVHTRSFLMLPQMHEVDFRASCFCHKRAIDLGHVCSVCLSIFCEALQECSTCGTAFPSSDVGRKRKSQQLVSSLSKAGSGA